MTERRAGMALVAVLWVLAALASAAMVLTQQWRHEAQRRADHAVAVRAQALAQAALVHVIAAGALESPPPAPPVRAWRVSLEGATISLQLRSAADAIDLNHAPRDLVAAALRHLGGLEEGAARRWADAIVDERERRRASGDASGLSPYQSVADLLVAPGLPWVLWLRVESAFTVDSAVSAVDPWAARPAVLFVLAGGDAARADTWQAARASRGQPDWSSIPAAWIGAASGDRLVVEAEVPLDDGQAVQVRWLLVRSSGTPDGLPWKMLRQTVQRHTSPG